MRNCAEGYTSGLNAAFEKFSTGSAFTAPSPTKRTFEFLNAEKEFSSRILASVGTISFHVFPS